MTIVNIKYIAQQRLIIKIVFSQSRRHDSGTGDDSDHDRHSSSRSKSRKKSSKTTRSPKRRSRFAFDNS